MSNKKCAYCSSPIQGYGHNGQPVRKGRVCDLCIYNVVIPARFELMNLEKAKDVFGEDEQHD